MRTIATDSQANLSDEVLGDASPRSCRAAEPFAGLPIALAALEFASARHAGQYRETDRAPLIAHPIEVGCLLRCNGQPDEVVAAGLLHDLVEKTVTTRAELHLLFGAHIARLVEAVSDDQSIGDYEARKRDLRERVAHSDIATAAIFAADKISKVRELAQLTPWQLHETARPKLPHYRASLEMLRRVTGTIALVDLLDAELSRFVPPRSPISSRPTRRGNHNERKRT